MKLKTLLLAFFLMLLSVAAFAQGTKEQYVVIKDGIATFYFDTDKSTHEGALPIQSAYDDSNWPEDTRNSVTKVVFDASFKECTPTSCDYWFYEFINLTEISGMKENLNTSNVESMVRMFAGCSSLTTLDVSGFDTKNVTNMGSMFYWCLRLTTLDVSNFNTENVTNMYHMFCWCVDLTTVDVSNFNTTNVTNMNSMFYQCSLTTLDVSGFDTQNVKSMENMFGCCDILTLDLSNFNTANVKNMRYMFGGCSSLEAIFVGDGWSTAAVTSSSDMFTGCRSLYGSKGTAYNADIADATYAKIDGGKDDPGYLTKSGEPAFDAHKPYAIVKDGVATFYSGISIPDGALPMRTEMDDKNWTADIRSSITEVVFDKTFKEYKPVKLSYWFNSMENLTKLSGMENINTSKVEYMSEMFQFCKKLKTLDLSGFNTAKVTDMTRLFYGCENLESIFVGDNWSTSSVTKSSGMFEDCAKLYGGKGTAYNADITDATYAIIDGGIDHPGYFTKSGEPAFIPIFAYAIVKDGTVTFYSGTSIPDGSLPMRTEMDDKNWTADIRSSITKVVFDKSFINFQPTKLAYWFNSMSNLQEISGLENLKTENVESMNQMFQFCKKLKTLDLSGFNTAKVTTMDKMFWGCEKLQCIYVGDNWITSAVTKSSGMFSDCYTLFGGKGTAYNEDKIDVAYAHIDGGTENPGYLTKSGDPAFWPYHAYVVEKDSTLTFYYDTNTPEGACDLNPNSDNWRSLKNKIIKVVFDDSFKNYRPTSCALWFDGFRKLTTIIGIKENLNTEDVTSMRYMFRECNAVASLDLSGFNTENVTNMAEMFYGCIALPTLDLSSFNTGKVENMSKMFTNTNLEAVFVGDGWSTAAVTASADMFQFCYLILGGKGSSPNILQVYDATYAKIDGGAENPGYFTKSGDPAFQRVIVSIQVSTLPQTEYAFGQNFSAENGKLTLTYNTGETKKVKLSEATITGYDNTKNGEQTLKVEYQGVETTFTVKVGTTTTPVSSITDQSSIKVWCYNSTIYIENAPDTKYTIIDTNGRLITTSTTKSTKEEIKINKTGLLIVIIDNQSFKLMN